MALAHLKALKKFCPTGTAEGEIGIRNEVFVQFPNFIDLIIPTDYSPAVLLGRKGSGKSLLVDFAIEILEAKKVPCAKLRPKELNLDAIPDNASVAQAHRDAYSVLIRAAAAALGEQLTGVLSESENKLRNEAIASESCRADVITSLAKSLPKIASKLVDVDIAGLLPQQNAATVKTLSASLKKALLPSSESRAIFIFVDDTDQVASPDRPTHLNRIWGLLLAARELASLSKDVKCIVTLRQEVWMRLTNDKAGNLDQTDHFFSLTRQLDPKPEELGRIVHRRLNLAMREAHEPKFADAYTTIFDGNKPKMPSSEDITSWEDMIVTRARGRPRDAVQFLNSLATCAINEDSPKITENHVASIIGDFSKSRVKLICEENQMECPALPTVIRSFAPRRLYDQGSFKISTKSVMAHLLGVPSIASVQLFGSSLHPGDREDAYTLLNFLFRLGFLNARMDRPGGRYVHISPLEDPNLANERNQNSLQSVTWEVHPAYRDYLLLEQKDLLLRTH